MDNKRVVCCLLFFSLGFCCGQNAMSPETTLKKNLMANYDKSIRPMYNPNGRLTVGVSFLLKSIQKIDEKNQIMTSFGWIIMQWKDEFLTWDPTQYSNTYRLVLPAEDIWLPEVAMFNSVNQGDDISLSVKFRTSVFHDGTVLFAPGYKWETKCTMDLTTFPFDNQSCNVSFVNWVYMADSLLFKTDGISLSAYETNDEWDLVNAEAVDFIWLPDGQGDTKVPQVYFTVNLKRRSIYYNLNVLTPCFIIAMLSCLVFMLPSDAGEKVSLSITVLLSFTVILLIVSDITPRSGLVMPRITLFIIMCMGETAVSLMVTIILLNFYHHPGNKPVCACFRKFVFGPLASMVCLRKTVDQQINMNNKVSPGDPENSLSQMLRESSIQPEDLDDIKTKHGIPDDVIVYLRFLMKKEKEKELEENYQAEWRTMALILDRLNFYAFFVITLLGIIGFTISLLY